MPARSGEVSSRTLARLFRRETGMTVLDFVLQRRIARACHHLTTSDLSCIEIAFAVGFQSVQNFNRTFRKLKDATPREWRQAAAQGMRRPGTTPKKEELLWRGAESCGTDRLPVGRDGSSSD